MARAEDASTAHSRVARYRALVEYDGAAYLGYQRQLPEQPTIQGALEQALEQIAGLTVPVLGAGRTDSGVHASGQVISFELAWPHKIAALQRALNATLPADIAIAQLAEVDSAFHPRYDARRRTYEYFVYNRSVRSPLRRRNSWHIRAPLDMQRMNRAASGLIGQHDFATFGRAPVGDNTVRQIFAAEWRTQDEYLVFRVTANAYLHRMVRSLVASLCKVGDGSWRVAEFQEAFAACDRSRSGGLAPSQGLFMVLVEYDESVSPAQNTVTDEL